MKIIKEDDVNFNSYCKEFLTGMEGLPHEYTTLFTKWAMDDFNAKGHFFKDVSFVLLNANKVVCLFLVTIQTMPNKEKKISYYGLPSVCLYDETQYFKIYNTANKLIKNEFNKLKSITDGKFIYRDRAINNRMDVITKSVMLSGGKMTPVFVSVIDLNMKVVELRGAIRKSYKSLINWGEKNIETRLFDQNNISEKQIKEFKALHVQESGRETRNWSNWLIQLEMIKKNQAFIILGYLEGKLVTAGFFNYSSDVCNYGSSASERKLFNKPLFHSVLWEAILYSKELGCKKFELGKMLFEGQCDEGYTKKEIDISQFKSGFASETKIYFDISN